MDTVKTYRQVNADDERLSFGISRMEDIYDKRDGVTDEPHRHNYFTIVVVLAAKGKHLIDFQEYELKPNQVYFVSPGQVHQIVEQEKSRGFAIVFSSEFLAKNNIPLHFIDDLNLFQDFGHCPPLELSTTEMEKLGSYAHEMIAINSSQNHFKYEAIGALLKLILIHCNNLCSLPAGIHPNIDGAHTLLRNFKTLIHQHYQQWHTTSEYAQQLNITPDHLNRVVKSLTGKTAKEHIQSRITVAAKRLLYFTELSNKEIGYELGFSEASNFSTFFKKATGQTPSTFRLGS